MPHRFHSFIERAGARSAQANDSQMAGARPGVVTRSGGRCTRAF